MSNNRRFDPVPSATVPGQLLDDWEANRRHAMTVPAPKGSPREQVARYLQQTYGIAWMTALRILKETELSDPALGTGTITSPDDTRLSVELRFRERRGQLKRVR